MPRFIHNLPQEEFIKAHDYLNKVSIVDSSSKRLKASVKGSASSPYQVSLQKSELHEEIYGFCSCPRFISVGYCKHIAAVFLKESGTFFDDWNGDYEFVNNAFIMPTSEIQEPRDTESSEFEDLYENFLYEQKRTKEEKHKTPEDFYQEKTSKSKKNIPELVWYIVDFYEDYTGVKVEFYLQCQSRLSSGKLGKVKDIKINSETIRFLPNSLDQEILNLLSAYGRWEFSYTKYSSTFHNGEFYLKENRELFKKMLQSNRVIKRTYSYYDVDEDKHLTLSPHLAQIRIDINSIERTAKPYILIDNNRVSYKDFDPDLFDNLLLKYDVFYEIDSIDTIKNNLYNMLRKCHEDNLLLSNEQWNTLQKLLLKNLPHHMLTGDKFNLKIDAIDIYFELYLKWEDNTNLIRGFIYVPESVNDNSLVELNYNKLENFVRTFQAFNFSDNNFLLESQYLHGLCQYADENKIPMFFKKQKLKAAKSFNIDVTSGISWLDLHPKLDFHGLSKTINFREVLKRVDLKANTIQLSDNEVGIIPEDWAKKIKLLEQHAVVTKEGISLHPAKALVLDEFPEIKTQKNIRLLKAELENFEKIKELKEDSKFQGTLRPYQRLALGWLDFLERCRFGGCLADDMGLGKTIQIIAHLQKKFKASKGLKILILCPKSLTGNWQNEFTNFAPEIKTFNWDSKKLSEKNFESYNVFFVSYQLLQRQKDFNFKFDYLILDEAQMIKNPSSLTHKAVSKIQARNKFALTGTPVENHTGDLMSIFNIVIPGLFESKNIKDPTALENFNFLRPFILRRTKESVLSDLPQKTIQTIYCDQSPKEKKEYLSVHIAMKKELEQKEENKFSKLMFLQVLTKLRQAANHIKLIDNASKLDSAKIETLKGLVNEIHSTGNKVIIFSQFTKLLKLVQKELNLDSSNSSYLDGSTRKRDEVVKDFKNKKELQTFLISIKAGGVGLNLTNASYCIILDPWWNPAVESQAIDRIHRIGQKKPVFAYRLITRDTIEEKVHELQNSKRELYDTILSSDEGFIKELKKTDIEFLLS